MERSPDRRWISIKHIGNNMKVAAPRVPMSPKRLVGILSFACILSLLPANGYAQQITTSSSDESEEVHEYEPDTITLGKFSSVAGMAVNTQTGLLYVLDSSIDGVFVYVIDNSDQIVHTIKLDTIYGSGITVNEKTNTIYVSQSDPGGGLAVIDGSTDRVVDLIAKGIFAHNLITNTEGNRVYAIQTVPRDKVYVIDAENNAIVGTISTGTKLQSMEINRNTDRIYLTDADRQGQVFVIDGSSAKIIDTISLSGDLSSLTINPQTDRLYVGDSVSNRLYIVDASNDQLLNTIPFQSNLVSVAVSPISNNIFVLNTTLASYSVLSPKVDGIAGRNLGTVTIIDAAEKKGNTVLDKVGVGYLSLGILAVNPGTSKVYVGKPADAGIDIIDTTTNKLQYSSFGLFLMFRYISIFTILGLGVATIIAVPYAARRWKIINKIPALLVRGNRWGLDERKLAGTYLLVLGVAFLLGNTIPSFGVGLLFLLIYSPWTEIPFIAICILSIVVGRRLCQGKTGNKLPMICLILWALISFTWLFASDLVPDILTILIKMQLSGSQLQLSVADYLLNISIMTSSLVIMIVIRFAGARRLPPATP